MQGKPYPISGSWANQIREDRKLGIKNELVVLIDMDDTITHTSKYRSQYSDIFHGRVTLPNDFFIPGALEFIRDLKAAGIKVGVVSHAFGGYKDIVERALKEKYNIEVDSFITSEEVFYTVSHDKYLTEKYAEIIKKHSREKKELPTVNDLVKQATFTVLNVCGKGVDATMAKMSFENMGIDHTHTQTRINLITIGDRIDDMLLAHHAKKHLSVANATPVNIHAARETSNEDRAMMLKIAKESINPAYTSKDIQFASVAGFADIYKIVLEKFGKQIKPSSSAPQPIKLPNPVTISTSPPSSPRSNNQPINWAHVMREKTAHPLTFFWG